jgi:hypothetical protein
MGSAHPDADIYPEATGPAAKIVAAHQKDEPITLYSGWFCPFVQRAWITLEEKKIPYKYVEINPYNKEPRFEGFRSSLGDIPRLTRKASSSSTREVWCPR